MANEIITCPKCGYKIPLTEAFAHEYEEKFEARLKSELKKRDVELEAALRQREKELGERQAVEKKKAEEQIRRQIAEANEMEFLDLKYQLQEKGKQLDSARQAELELRKRQRELEDREKTMQIDNERLLAGERKKLWDEASARISEEHRLKEMEAERQLSDLRKQIEEWKRKAEVTSQQLQGEVLEIQLEGVLLEKFRSDRIEPVAKGQRGADVLQEVRDETGQVCGTLIWESKRTKAWSDGWIGKLKDDQRQVKAEIAVLVSTTLPRDVQHFAFLDGIWVTDFESLVGLATALRIHLIEVAYAKKSLQGKNEKMEVIYQYLFSTQFKQRIEAIVQSFHEMKDDLDRERTAMEKMWSKREKQMQRVLQNTAGLHGDLQGIIGAALPEVKLLELPSD